MTEADTTTSTPIDSYSAFVSHSSNDREVAEELCAHLEQRGMRCWIAPRNVRPGRNYGEEIVRGIERSKCLVLILSDDSNSSRPVKDEVECAYRKGKPVFPVRIEEVPPSPALEFFISSSHWIDAWTGDMTQHVERLAEGLAGHATDTPFQITGRQLKRRLASVGLAWPIIAGIAVLGLVIAVWKLGGSPAEHAVEMPDFAEIQSQMLEALPEDTARVMEEFDPELITADAIDLNFQGQQGSGWGVTLEIPSWFYGRFDFRNNVKKLMYSTDGDRYLPGASIQTFLLPPGADVDRVWIKFVLADGTETEPLVYDIDLEKIQMAGAEVALGQYNGPRGCRIRFSGPGCVVMDGWLQTKVGTALASVRVAQDEDFDEDVVDLYWPSGEWQHVSYSPPPDADEFFLRVELANGVQSQTYRVGIQSADWPHWVRLDGSRESGEPQFDRVGSKVLYAAYEGGRSRSRWQFWGPGLDCRRMTLRFALDNRGLLPATCGSSGLTVDSPGEADELYVEYELPQLGSAVYRYEVDYLELAVRSMYKGIDTLDSYLSCRQRGGSSPELSCYWNDDISWRLPVVERLEFGPSPDELSGRAEVGASPDAILDLNRSGRRLYNRNEAALTVAADWRDLFVRLVLEDGSTTDPKRMLVR